MVAKKDKTSVIVDTYTLLSMAYGEVGSRAKRILEEIRRGEAVGVLPVTVIYEYTIHWHRGRIPVLKSIEEVITFLSTYFKVENLTLSDWIKAAETKYYGDKLLKEAEDQSLRARSLSIIDSTIIAVALRLKTSIISGDRDLTYVAKNMGVEVIW